METAMKRSGETGQERGGEKEEVTRAATRLTRRLFCFEEVPLLEMVLELPDPAGLPAPIGAYYDALREAYFAASETLLFPRARAAYEGDKAPGRRFSFRRYLFRLTCRAEVRGAWFSVSRRAEFIGEGLRRVSETGEVFSLSDGRLCPLSCFLGRRARRRAGKASGGRLPARGHISLTDTGLAVYVNGRRRDVDGAFLTQFRDSDSIRGK